LVYDNQHLNELGLRRILELSKEINVSGNKKYKREDLLKIVAR